MNQLSSFGNSTTRPPLGEPNVSSELYMLIQELSQTTRPLPAGESESAARLTYGTNKHDSTGLIATRLRELLLDRARQKSIFPAEIFADPAWDILLHLYASHLDQQRETMTGIICLAGVPATTGLRWVHKLVEVGLLALRDDPLDLRRKWVLLTPTALCALEAYFTVEPPCRKSPCAAS